MALFPSFVQVLLFMWNCGLFILKYPTVDVQGDTKPVDHVLK